MGRHFCVGRDGSFGMTGLRVPRARWVTCIAASVLPSHVHNQRFRALRLDFKGGDERVFGLDDHMFGFSLQLHTPCREQPSSMLDTASGALMVIAAALGTILLIWILMALAGA